MLLCYENLQVTLWHKIDQVLCCHRASQKLLYQAPMPKRSWNLVKRLIFKLWHSAWKVDSVTCCTDAMINPVIRWSSLFIDQMVVNECRNAKIVIVNTGGESCRHIRWGQVSNSSMMRKWERGSMGSTNVRSHVGVQFSIVLSAYGHKAYSNEV